MFFVYDHGVKALDIQMQLAVEGVGEAKVYSANNALSTRKSYGLCDNKW